MDIFASRKRYEWRDNPESKAFIDDELRRVIDYCNGTDDGSPGDDWLSIRRDLHKLYGEPSEQLKRYAKDELIRIYTEKIEAL